jgi:hypothetical protein
LVVGSRQFLVRIIELIDTYTIYMLLIEMTFAEWGSGVRDEGTVKGRELERDTHKVYNQFRTYLPLAYVCRTQMD